MLKGTKMSKKGRENISKGLLGRKQSKDIIIKRINSRKGYRHTKETIKKIRIANTGKKRSEITKKNVRNAMINYHKNHEISAETRQKISIKRKEFIKNNPTKHNWYGHVFSYKRYKHQGFQKNHPTYLSDDTYKKIFSKLLSHSQNKSEKELELLLLRITPGEYEYVGDGKKFIGRKCPDFINKKRRKIIELFGEYWHDKYEEITRKEYFKKYNYKTFIIWFSSFKKKSNRELLIYNIKKFTYGV